MSKILTKIRPSGTKILLQFSKIVKKVPKFIQDPKGNRKWIWQGFGSVMSWQVGSGSPKEFGKLPVPVCRRKNLLLLQNLSIFFSWLYQCGGLPLEAHVVEAVEELWKAAVGCIEEMIAVVVLL